MKLGIHLEQLGASEPTPPETQHSRSSLFVPEAPRALKAVGPTGRLQRVVEGYQHLNALKNFNMAMFGDVVVLGGPTDGMARLVVVGYVSACFLLINHRRPIHHLALNFSVLVFYRPSAQSRSKILGAVSLDSERSIWHTVEWKQELLQHSRTPSAMDRWVGEPRLTRLNRNLERNLLLPNLKRF